MPTFRYHPDPVSTGSAVASTEACAVCRVARGLRYTGPIYGRQVEHPCLVCIDSGVASDRLGGADFPAIFTDYADAPSEVPGTVVEVVTRRTPGFVGWQQPRWLYHCADAAAFLGPVGYAQVVRYSDAVATLRQEQVAFGWSSEEADRYIRSLDQDHGPTGYLFRCLHCGQHLAYSDMD